MPEADPFNITLTTAEGLLAFRKPWNPTAAVPNARAPTMLYQGNKTLNKQVDDWLTRELTKFIKARLKHGFTSTEIQAAITKWKPGDPTSKPKPSEAEKLLAAIQKLPTPERQEVLKALEKEKGTT